MQIHSCVNRNLTTVSQLNKTLVFDVQLMQMLCVCGQRKFHSVLGEHLC